VTARLGPSGQYALDLVGGVASRTATPGAPHPPRHAPVRSLRGPTRKRRGWTRPGLHFCSFENGWTPTYHLVARIDGARLRGDYGGPPGSRVLHGAAVRMAAQGRSPCWSSATMVQPGVRARSESVISSIRRYEPARYGSSSWVSGRRSRADRSCCVTKGNRWPLVLGGARAQRLRQAAVGLCGFDWRAPKHPRHWPAASLRTMLVIGLPVRSGGLPAVCAWKRSCCARAPVAPRTDLICAHQAWPRAAGAARNFATSLEGNCCGQF
jgi:hypothetical protein